jgi:hypothetical protein
MGIKVTNNAYGTLNASINSSATSIVLTAGQGSRFPTLSAGDYFYATLIDTSNNLEIVKVTARSTDTLTVVRGQDSTTARAYATNDRFELRPTAALFNEKANDADVIATYLAKAGGTMTGDLGVGATPLARMHATKAGAEVARFTNSQTNGGDWEFKIGGNGFENRKLMITDKYGGADNVRLSIDDGGRVLKPSQPAFSAIGTGTQSWSGSSAAQVLNITINTGGLSSARNSHFNTSTKRFTAPVAGVYALFHGYTATGAATGPESYLTVNGSTIYRMGVIGYLYSGGYFTASSFEIINLNANDYVEVRVQNNNNTSFSLDLGRSYFGGYLIG